MELPSEELNAERGSECPRKEERRRKNEELRKEVKKQEERLAGIQKLKLISPDSLYLLRELVRRKHAFDVEI